MLPDKDKRGKEEISEISDENNAGKTPNGTSRTIGSIVRGFKIGVTKELGYSPWHRNYYERITRDDYEYNNVARYIEQNPYKW